MSKSNWAALAAVVVLIIFAFVIVRVVNYGTGTTAYTPPQRELAPPDLSVAAISARNEAVDNPQVSKGVAVVDFAHDNALYVEELNTLFTRLVSRGYAYELVWPEQNDVKGETLIDRLQYASILILPLPRASYSAAETAEIERFVGNGGRVLIIGDPTRTIDVNALNSIAGEFGIIYANDYLYSLNGDSMDNNYRNVIYTNFADSPVTAGLSDGGKVVFYSGSSLSAPGHEIILGDDTTHSSTSESNRTMAAAALTTNDQVLALGDLTFFSAPYHAVENNGDLINNIAAFLTGGNRTFDLTDFPYYFKDKVDIVFDDTRVFNSQFADAVKIKDAIEANGGMVDFIDKIGSDNDAIFVGRFTEASVVQDYLDRAGIVILDRPKDKNGDTGEKPAIEPVSDIILDETNGGGGDEETDQEFVEGSIQIEGVGQLERGGSTLFYLDQHNGQNVLIILSDSPTTNADAFELLLEKKLNECVVGPAVAVCQTKDPTGKLPPSLRSSRIDKVLVVSGDTGRTREDELTGADEFVTALGDKFKVSTWVTSDGEGLVLDELQEYDAIIWATGDYWDDSINEEQAELLTQYIEAGGNLILSGASIAFDWDHTDFLANIVHADYLTQAEQVDLQVTLPDHPLAKGWAEGDVLTMSLSPSDELLLIDVVKHTPNSRVVIQRGPGSEQAGAAAVIAYEDDRSKVAYYAFPLYLLSPETSAQLVGNTIDWFSRKPLDLPDEGDYQPFETDETESEEAPADTGEEPPTDEGENGAEDDTNQDENGNDDNTDNGEDQGDQSGQQ